MDEHTFVFIGGMHRSGTSIFFKSLREHPQVSGFEGTDSSEDEGMHLQSVYKPSYEFGGAGRFAFDKEAHLTEKSDLVTEENRQTLFTEWSRYWDTDKPILLEKSPPNLIMTRFLQAMFPNSVFVVLMRHPISVSYATQRWYTTARISGITIRTLFEHWLRAHDLFMEDRHLLQRYYLIRYEDFVSAPQTTLDYVYSLIGLDSHPCTLEIRPNVNEKYFQRWREHPLKPMNRNALTRDFEDRFRTYGYSLTDLYYSGTIKALEEE